MVFCGSWGLIFGESGKKVEILILSIFMGWCGCVRGCLEDLRSSAIFMLGVVLILLL